MQHSPLFLFWCFFLSATGLFAQDYGPVIADYGPTWEIDHPDFPTISDEPYRVVFDVAKGPESPADQNPSLITLARFLNMHAASGVPVEDIHLAIVVHGGAIHDVSTERAGQNADLVAALVEHGVRFYVCGQSAAWYDVSSEDLLPGVDLALSAMTMHALLQADGYSLNPF